MTLFTSDIISEIDEGGGGGGGGQGYFQITLTIETLKHLIISDDFGLHIILLFEDSPECILFVQKYRQQVILLNEYLAAFNITSVAR